PHRREQFPRPEPVMTARAALVVSLAFVAGTPAADAPRPPRLDLAELPGPLVLAAGRDVPDDVRDAFFALAGKDKAKIVVIPAAIKDADEQKEADDILM